MTAKGADCLLYLLQGATKRGNHERCLSADDIRELVRCRGK
jgi:hypothetical protein